MRRQSDARVPLAATDVLPLPTTDEIAVRAFTLYEGRSREDGHDVEDWLEAERQLLEERARQLAIA